VLVDSFPLWHAKAPHKNDEKRLCSWACKSWNLNPESRFKFRLFFFGAQLDPNLKRPWSEEEERKLVASQMKIPGRFTDISKYFHLRSDIALEMHWNEILQSRHDEVARHVTDQVGLCSVLVPFVGHRARHPHAMGTSNKII
jgi:hypothetical protein